MKFLKSLFKRENKRRVNPNPIEKIRIDENTTIFIQRVDYAPRTDLKYYFEKIMVTIYFNAPILTLKSA